MDTVLVTGGAGFIGSHTLVELLNAGLQVVSLDNYCNGAPEALRRVQTITGKPLIAIEGDVRDGALLDTLFDEHPIDGVIHFAALKAVAESTAKPVEYYDNNVGGTLSLLRAMQRSTVRKIVFSSSATVYGEPGTLPINEDAPIRTTNPYGASKAMIEQILSDLAQAAPDWSIASLRYFNPIGAHPSGEIGEDPAGIPNNLFPFLIQTAAGKRASLTVFGDDWPTVDGTGVRDYLHVVDLAAGHVRALAHVRTATGFIAINLGTGRGTSVLELIDAFRAATGISIPYTIGPRRSGDIAACWADPLLAIRLLNWRAKLTIAQACADGWRWQRSNPDGYRQPPTERS